MTRDYADYEAWCSLTEGNDDTDSEAELREEKSYVASLVATPPDGGWVMGDATSVEDVSRAGVFECEDADPHSASVVIDEVEDLISRLDDVDRAIAVGKLLPALTEDAATMVICEALCRMPHGRAVVTREMLAMLANGLAAANAAKDTDAANGLHAAITAALAQLAPESFAGLAG